MVPAGTTIPAGGYYAIYTEINQSPGFGLGVGDSVNLFLGDGTTQVDTTTWGPHAATTWGRCPDGTGDFRDTTTSTRGLANACSPVRINEIESDGGTPGDWVELKNISAAPVDISGWVFKDNDDADVYTIPAGTTIAANGYQVLDVADFVLRSRRRRLGAAVRRRAARWSSPTPGRPTPCRPTAAARTASASSPTPRRPPRARRTPAPDWRPGRGPAARRWTTADLTGTFVQDLSGLVFDPADPDILWAAQNKLGTLFKMVRDGNNWVPAAGWPKDPKFLGGTGAPDTEGITIGPDGFVYLASERDNSASGVSRMSILRYDPSAAGSTLTPTNEWNLTSKIPAAGANLGLEGVTWVPDSYLVAGGFVDQSTGSAYTRPSYPLHGTGLYVVAVEDTGDLHAFALDSDGTTSHLVATIDSGFPHLADVNFDPEKGRALGGHRRHPRRQDGAAEARPERCLRRRRRPTTVRSACRTSTTRAWPSRRSPVVSPARRRSSGPTTATPAATRCAADAIDCTVLPAPSFVGVGRGHATRPTHRWPVRVSTSTPRRPRRRRRSRRAPRPTVPTSCRT